MQRMIFRGLLAALMTVAVVACGDGGLTDLATETCDDLEGSIVLTAGVILQGAIDDAADLGFTGPELGAKMREVCPGIMLALEGVGDEQERRDNLPNEMTLVVDACTSDGANGTVRNDSDVTVDIYIDVQFEATDGTLVDSGTGSVSGLRPGQTGEWDASYFGDTYARCSADIGSVFES